MFVPRRDTEAYRVRFVIENISQLVTTELFIIGPVGQRVRY